MATFLSSASSLLLADAGTALMWATLIHLTIGNLVVALLEYAIVRVVFKTKSRALLPWLIAANYTSAIAGSLLISRGSDRKPRPCAFADSDPPRVRLSAPVCFCAIPHLGGSDGICFCCRSRIA
jgi:hypothetical protein